MTFSFSQTFLTIEASTKKPAAPIQTKHDPSSVPQYDTLITEPTTPTFDNPQPKITTSRWSTPFPPRSEQEFEIVVQSTAHALIISLSPNNPRTFLFASNSNSAQHVTATIQLPLPNNNINSQSPTITYSPQLPHSIVASSLVKLTSCTNTQTVSSANHFLPSWLPTFPNIQTLTTPDNHSIPSNTPFTNA